MTLAQLRAKLARSNLSQLARTTEIDIRTLRRLKNGTGDVMGSTMDKLAKAFLKVKQ